jgi:cell division protein FtsN
MALPPEIPIGTGVCETCAERGRPREPVCKIGMCEFRYKGLPHPEAPSRQLKRELLGAHARQRLNLADREQSTGPDGDAEKQQNQKRTRERVY